MNIIILFLIHLKRTFYLQTKQNSPKHVSTRNPEPLQLLSAYATVKIDIETSCLIQYDINICKRATLLNFEIYQYTDTRTKLMTIFQNAVP